jgi:hypothetical protein
VILHHDYRMGEMIEALATVLDASDAEDMVGRLVFL